MNTEFSKLADILQDCREHVTVLQPEDERDKYWFYCLQAFFDKIENATRYRIREIERGSASSSSYKRLDEVCDV